MELEHLTEEVIGCAIRVHKALGPGFLESIYENALKIELERAELNFTHQEELPVTYLGQEVGTHRYDLIIESELVVELKAVSAFQDIHFAQVRSYLSALDLAHGLLLNFATMPLGIKRVFCSPLS